MVESKLIVLGDSVCHGIGTVTTTMHEDNTQFAFGKFVAERLGRGYVNLAEPGSSVGRVIEKGFYHLPEIYQPGDLVIVGWTSPFRLNLCHDDRVLQILPEFVWLGNPTETDLYVDSSVIKCVTDKSNEPYLDILPRLHRACVDNDLFQGMANQAYAQAAMFRSWLRENKMDFRDFSVFGYGAYQSILKITFAQVMGNTNRHPTIQEQQSFANLMFDAL